MVFYLIIRAAAEEGGEQNSRAAQQSSQGILRFYTDDAPGFQMWVLTESYHYDAICYEPYGEL